MTLLQRIWHEIWPVLFGMFLGLVLTAAILLPVVLR